MESQTITLTLPLSEVVKIIGALGQMPFSQVADLIAEVRKQAQAQIQSPPTEPTP